MLPGTFNCSAERVCMIYRGELWGFAVANLDLNTLEADIQFPYAMNSKNSAPAILLNYLYVLMSRKGAGKVRCTTDLRHLELMNSIRFLAPR